MNQTLPRVYNLSPLLGTREDYRQTNVSLFYCARKRRRYPPDDGPLVSTIHRSLCNGRGRLIRPSPASWINLSGELMNERGCRVPRFGGTLIAVKHVLERRGEGRGEGIRRMKGKAWTREITMRPAIKRRGWKWKQAHSRTSRALEIQDSSKRGFRASEQTCAGDKRVLEWNSGCLSLPFRVTSMYTYTHTCALITVMELQNLNLNWTFTGSFKHFLVRAWISLNGSENGSFLA